MSLQMHLALFVSCDTELWHQVHFDSQQGNFGDHYRKKLLFEKHGVTFQCYPSNTGWLWVIYVGT